MQYRGIQFISHSYLMFCENNIPTHLQLEGFTFQNIPVFPKVGAMLIYFNVKNGHNHS